MRGLRLPSDARAKASTRGMSFKMCAAHVQMLEPTQRQSERYEFAFLQAVEQGLLVLGESVSKAIYFHIEEKCRIRREQFCVRTEDFDRALEGLFGAGGKVVGTIIAKRLYANLALDFEEHESWTLVDYANHARKVSSVIKMFQSKSSCSSVVTKG